MQREIRRTGDVVASSARYALDSRRTGAIVQTAELEPDDEDGSILPPARHADPEAHPLAPEQEAVLCDAAILTAAVAREGLQALELLQATATGKVLVLEPFVSTVGRRLREGGFQGERWALMSPLTRSGTGPLVLKSQLTGVADPIAARGNAATDFERIVVADWHSVVRERHTPKMLNEQRFQVVIALQLSRTLSPADWHETLCRVKEFLTPEGFLIVGEPAAWITQQTLEPAFLAEGMFLAADTRRVEDDWSWRVSRWQYRPSDLGRLPGVLARVSHSDLEASVALRNAVIVSFREVFGGEEWGEWMRCAACLRQYGRREFEELDPPARCECGAERSLEVFHTPQHVWAELSRDLADGERSRLYVCIGQAQEVEAFIWGYLTTARNIAQVLLPRQGEAEREQLTQRLLNRLARLGVSDPESALIYHQAYIGSVKQARSFSLPRALFARMCQFALDQGVRMVVTATIPSVNAYALLRGIEMDVVYTYQPLPAAVPLHDSADEVVMPYSRLDEDGVIVAGSVRDVLSLLVRKSDRGLVKAVGTFLRQQRESASATEGAIEGGSDE